MELITKDMPSTFRLALAGDFHYGNAAWHSRGVEKLLGSVEKEPDLYLLLMGDLMESVSVDHKHFCADVHDAQNVPLVQAEKLIEMLTPVKHKIITSLEGNHEFRYRSVGHFAKFIADKLEVPFGTYSCKINFKNKNQSMFKMFCTHGRKTFGSNATDPVRRKANSEIALKTALQPLAGDTAIMCAAHSHRILVCKPAAELYLTDDGAKIEAHYTGGVLHTGGYISFENRYYVNTGSYLRSNVLGASTYSEMAMMAPNQLGHAVLTVEDGKIKGVAEVHAGTN